MPDGMYYSTLLASVPNIVHGYSSRDLGDMRKGENRNAVLNLLTLKPERLVTSQQVHGRKIQIVSDARHLGKEIPDADGLVSAKRFGPMSLAVRVADCVPILAVDPQASVIGVAHAGWKGTLGGISGELMAAMKSVGANIDHTLASIGPHIGMCCYNVSEERAAQFFDVFERDPLVVSRLEGAMHVDIGYTNQRQLLAAGVKREHIDNAITCTSCQADTYYSYRKDSKETFGEILGIIGFSI